MSEWPKTMSEREASGSVQLLRDPREGLRVIPADLGQELYEALGAARAAGERCYPIVQGKKATRALARYEREVGK